MVIESSQNSLGLPKKFFHRIAIFQVVLVFASLILSSLITRYYFKDTFVNQIKVDLKESLDTLKISVEQGSQNLDSWCDVIMKKETSTRFTLLDASGVPACDNLVNVDNLLHVKDTSEVIAALDNGNGFSIRKSEVLKKEMVYGAILVKSQVETFVIRKAIALDSLDETFTFLDRTIILILIPIFIIFTLFSISRSHILTEPLRKLIIRLQGLVRDSESFKTEDLDDELEGLESAFSIVENNIRNYIDELYLENEKNEILIQSISDGILAISKSNNVLLINENFRLAFLPGYVEREGITGQQNIWDLLRNAKIKQSFERITVHGEDRVKEHIEVLLRNNQKGFFDLTVSPIHNAKGEAVGAIGIFHDESDKKLTQQMRTDFVTNVSHEVRSPLTAMKGYVQILASQPDAVKPELRDYLNRIEQNCERLILLFNDVLNLSVINSKATLDISEIDPVEMIRSVHSNVKQGYSDKHIEFIDEIEVSKFIGDSLLIEQLLTNLIDNAFKYNKDNGTVKVSFKDTSGGYELIVEDNGIGIPEKHWPRLFERFYRVDPSRSREMGGTGLGLAIVKHIVLKHSGQIDVSKSPLGGSRFKMIFPHRKLS